MTTAVAALFHDALLGLQFLHANHWLHGDIKPQNIGIIGAPPRAVLLDLGSAMRLELDALIPPTPGRGGTIWYLAPEREMQAYNHLVDVWAMGTMGYELTYGYLPWKFSLNPWRPGEDNERLRPVFDLRYEEAMNSMSQRHEEADIDRKLFKSLILSSLT